MIGPRQLGGTRMAFFAITKINKRSIILRSLGNRQRKRESTYVCLLYGLLRGNSSNCGENLVNGKCDAAMSVDPYHGFSGKERGEDRFLHRLNRGLKDIVDCGVGIVEPLFAEKQSVWVIGNPVRSTEGDGELSAPILASSPSAGDAKACPLRDSYKLPV